MELTEMESLTSEKDAAIDVSLLLDFNVASHENQFVMTWIAVVFTCMMYTVLVIFGVRNFFKYIVTQ